MNDEYDMNFLENDVENDIITLVDENGIEREFEVLDYFEESRGKFYALAPRFELDSEDLVASETYFIFKIINTEKGEEFIEVEDDVLLDEISEEFQKRLDIV